MERNNIYNIDINNQIFNVLNSEDNIEEIKRSFYIINDKNGIRWLIENETSLISILNQWKPYKNLSYFFWKLIILLFWFKALSIIPISKKKFLMVSKNLILKKNNNLSINNFSFVCYVGRRNKDYQKSTIFVFDKINKKCIFIIKKAITQKSWEYVLYEYQILKKLEREKNQFSPRIYNIDYKNCCFSQEYVYGKPSPINLNFYHYQLLGSLLNRDKFIDFNKFKQEIVEFRLENKNSNNKELYYLINDIKKSLNFSIWKKKVNSVRIHGDLAPWNLKFSINKDKMIAYDWEESVDSHLPFYDLIFYKKTVRKLLGKNIKIDIQQYISALKEKGFILEDKSIHELYTIAKIFVCIKLKTKS